MSGAVSEQEVGFFGFLVEPVKVAAHHVPRLPRDFKAPEGSAAKRDSDPLWHRFWRRITGVHRDPHRQRRTRMLTLSSPCKGSRATPLLHVCKNCLPPILFFLRQNSLFSRRFQPFLTLGDKYTCRIVDARKAIASYARQPLLLRKQPH
jgi:hypothetical protein